jgi:hypothetical protein
VTPAFSPDIHVPSPDKKSGTVTFENNHYSWDFVRLCSSLLTLDVTPSRLPDVLEKVFMYFGFPDSRLPDSTTLGRWTRAFGLISRVLAAWEIWDSESVAMHPDGTSDLQQKYYASPFTLGVQDGEDTRVCLGIRTQPGGTSEETAKASFDELKAAGDLLQLFRSKSPVLCAALPAMTGDALARRPRTVLSDNANDAKKAARVFARMQEEHAKREDIQLEASISLTCGNHSMCLCEKHADKAAQDWVVSRIGETPDSTELGKPTNLLDTVVREYAKFFGATKKVWPHGHIHTFRVWFRQEHSALTLLPLKRCVGNHAYYTHIHTQTHRHDARRAHHRDTQTASFTTSCNTQSRLPVV